MSESMPLHPPSSRGGLDSWRKGSRAPGALPGVLASVQAKLERVRARPEIGLDVLRIYLGIALLVRGVLFLGDRSPLNQMLGEDWFAPYAIAHAVVMAHLAGGLLLALGCYTRLAAAVQIPLLAGAVFFVHLHEGLLGPSQSLELSALVLVALIVYAVFGSGPLSLDRYLDRPSPASSARVDAPAGEPSPRPLPPTPRRSDDAELGPGVVGVDLGLRPDSPEVAERYRDVKLELTYVLVALTVLVVLFAEAEYLWATVCFIVGFITFGVWRIGRARFE